MEFIDRRVLGAIEFVDAVTTQRLRTRLKLEPADQRVVIRATLKNGRLDVQPLQATLGGGAISGRVLLDASRPNAPTLSVQLDGKGINLEKVATAVGAAGTVVGGLTEVALNLSGPGESLHRFMGWSRGEVRLVVGPGQLSGTALDAGGDALTRIFDAANPST